MEQENRKVFTIDIGDMNPEMAKEHIIKMMQENLPTQDVTVEPTCSTGAITQVQVLKGSDSKQENVAEVKPDSE